METRIRRGKTTGGLIFFQLFVGCAIAEKSIQFSSVCGKFKQQIT